MATVAKSIPFVVPQEVPAPQPITQLELTVLLALRGRLAQLESQVQDSEQSIKTRLEKGAALESGDHHAELKENFRRNIAWKSIVIRLADRRSLLRESAGEHQAHAHGVFGHRVADHWHVHETHSS